MSDCTVITGASSGIGRAVAARLAAEGARLLLVGRNQARLDATAAAATACGAQCATLSADLTDPGAADDVVRHARTRFGAISALVLAAGVYEPAPLVDTSDASLDRMWRCNVYAPLALARAAHTTMPSGSCMVFVSSVSGSRPFANEAAYAATKGAVNSMVGALAVELAPRGIRVNGVAPGFTETEMNATVREDRAMVARAVAATPAGRLGRPDDVAAAVSYLLSTDAAYVRGAVLPVDGGYPTSAIQSGLIA